MARWCNTLIISSLIAVGFPGSANAGTSDMIDALKAQVSALTERIAQLEAQVIENAQRSAAVTTESIQPETSSSKGSSSASGWFDTVKLKGDFRYRHEAFDIENRRDRHRQRMRARAQITGQVSDSVSAVLGLASGGSDPISTNQTFDDASSSKGVVIDLAYATWKTPVEGLKVSAGKMKNPFHRAGGNGLVWDGDLNPEGIAMSFAANGLFANAMYSWLDESSSDDDSFLVGTQIGVRKAISETGALTAGAGYFHYFDSRGEPAFFDGSAAGNQLDAMGNYINGFEIAELFLEYTVSVSDGQLTLFGDVVRNLDADRYEDGFAVGAKFKQGALSAGYTYQELEPNAVLGTFSDSDFIGGGTDGKGHIIQAGYAISKRISLKGTLFLNDRNVDLGMEEEFKRLMLDISFKY